MIAIPGKDDILVELLLLNPLCYYRQILSLSHNKEPDIRLMLHRYTQRLEEGKMTTRRDQTSDNPNDGGSSGELIFLSNSLAIYGRMKPPGIDSSWDDRNLFLFDVSIVTKSSLQGMGHGKKMIGW